MVYKHQWRQNRTPDRAEMPVGVTSRYEADSECGRYVYHLYKSSHNGRSYSVDTAALGTTGHDPRWVRVHGIIPGTSNGSATAVIPGPLGLAKETADQLIAELDAEIHRQDRRDAQAVEVPAEYPDDGADRLHDIETDDDDDADPDPSPGPGGVRRMWSNVSLRRNRKSVAEQARAYGWSEQRYREVINNISDRFRDPAEVAARSLVDLIELRRNRTNYMEYVIPTLRFYTDIKLSELRNSFGYIRVSTAANNQAHLTRIARLNLTRLETLIRQRTAASAQSPVEPALPVSSEPDPEPVLNNGSPILLYADATRLEITLLRDGTALTREHTGTVAPPVKGRPYIKMEVTAWYADDAHATPRYHTYYHYDDITRATRDAADLLRGVATTDSGQWIVRSSDGGCAR